IPRGSNCGIRTCPGGFPRVPEIDPTHTATYVGQPRGRPQGNWLPVRRLGRLRPGPGPRFVAKVGSLLHGPGQIYISRRNACYHLPSPHTHGVADFRLAIRLDAEGAAREFLRILIADV